MKVITFCLIIITAFINFSCQQNVESSPIAVNEEFKDAPQPSPTPEEYEEVYIAGQFSRMEAGNEPTSLEFNDYKIKPIAVKKKYDEDSPVTDIYDAVLTKNGKTIARFEGVYYPLGNFMSFGLFPFLGDLEKQLVVIDESMKYERIWIVRVSPKYEELFDSDDYKIWWGRLRAVDIDKDGIYELSESHSVDVEFGLPINQTPWVSLDFKYDPKTRKYLPANHKLADYSLRYIDEQIQEFDKRNDKSFTTLIEILYQYFYAGKEEEAWKIFDEKIDLVLPNTLPRNVSGKEQIKKRILTELNKDPIYKFIKTDLQKEN